MAFLKWLIIIALVLWLFRKFGEFLFRSWIKNVTKSSGYQQYNDARTSGRKPQREEGEIFISKKTPPKDSQTDGLGDFVDYEELE